MKEVKKFFKPTLLTLFLLPLFALLHWFFLLALGSISPEFQTWSYGYHLETLFQWFLANPTSLGVIFFFWQYFILTYIVIPYGLACVVVSLFEKWQAKQQKKKK